MSNFAFALAVCTLLTVLTGAGLNRLLGSLYRQQSWLSIVGLIIPLATVWVLFIAGSSLFLLPTFQEWAAFYLITNPVITAVVCTAAAIAMLAYILPFQGANSLARSCMKSVTVTERHTALALTTVVPLLAIDWYGRFQGIFSGTYFRWMAPMFDGAYLASVTDPLQQVLGATGYASLALLLYLRRYIQRRSVRLLTTVVTALQVMLLAGRGSRRDVLFMVLMFLLMLAIEYRSEHRSGASLSEWSKRGVIITGVVTFIWVGIMSVPSARRGIRTGTLPDEPVQIVKSYLFDELPRRVLSPDVNEVDASPAKEMVGRVMSYTSFATAIAHRQIMDNKSAIGGMGFLQSAKTAVPAVLGAGDKIEPNRVLRGHYTQLAINVDPHSHPVSSGLGYLGLIGVPIVMLIGGTIAGTYMGLLTPLGEIGVYVAIGLLPALVPLGTDIGHYLANLRNGFLIISLLYIANTIIRRVPNVIQ